jgi:hypothetical protein
MNEKEILEKARRDYPPGTKFIGIFNKNVYIVDDDLSNTEKNGFLGINFLVVFVKDENNKSIISSGANLYQNGKWAEIISLPHPKIYELW